MLSYDLLCSALFSSALLSCPVIYGKLVGVRRWPTWFALADLVRTVHWLFFYGTDLILNLVEQILYKYFLDNRLRCLFELLLYVSDSVHRVSLRKLQISYISGFKNTFLYVRL
jgi:hypothetical protein